MGLGEDSLSHQSQPPGHNLTRGYDQTLASQGPRVPFSTPGVKGGVASNPSWPLPFGDGSQGSLDTYDPDLGRSQPRSTPEWPLEGLEDPEWPSYPSFWVNPDPGLDRAHHTWGDPSRQPHLGLATPRRLTFGLLQESALKGGITPGIPHRLDLKETQ